MTTDEAVAASAARTDEVVPEETDVAPVWLQRLSLFVLVLFCVYLGVLVAILPWWTRMWDQNIWIQSRPALAAVLDNGAVGPDHRAGAAGHLDRSVGSHTLPRSSSLARRTAPHLR